MAEKLEQRTGGKTAFLSLEKTSVLDIHEGGNPSEKRASVSARLGVLLCGKMQMKNDVMDRDRQL